MSSSDDTWPFVVPSALPRAALTIPEAAESIGVSLSTFRRHVLPTVRSVQLGSAVVIPRAELVAWLRDKAA